MTSHIAAYDSILSAQGGDPVVPELGAAPHPVLQPDRFLIVHTRISKIVNLVEHFASVGIEGKHRAQDLLHRSFREAQAFSICTQRTAARASLLLLIL